jgi:hypothetical protein
MIDPVTLNFVLSICLVVAQIHKRIESVLKSKYSVMWDVLLKIQKETLMFSYCSKCENNKNWLLIGADFFIPYGTN